VVPRVEAEVEAEVVPKVEAEVVPKVEAVHQNLKNLKLDYHLTNYLLLI
jgi:hypothetical protein